MDSFLGSGLSTSYQAALEDPLLKRSLSDSRVDVRAREAVQDDAKIKFEELVKR